MKLRDLLPQFINGTNGVIFVHDLLSQKTLENLLNVWYPLLNSNSSKVPGILVGTKADLLKPSNSNNKKIFEKYCKDLSLSTDLKTSSKTGLKIDQIFKELVREILRVPPYDKKNITIP